MIDDDKVKREGFSLDSKETQSPNDAPTAREREAFRLVDMAEAMAGVGHWRLDAMTNDVSWSAQVFRIHGMEPSEGPIDLARAIDVYHPDDRPIVAAHVSAALRDGTPYAFELRVIRPNGEVRHVLSRGVAELDADGRIVAVFGTFMDITETKRTEEALAASEARYRYLAENASDIIALYDLNSRFEYLSPSVEGVLGYLPEELIGRKTFDIIHPDDVSRTLQAFRTNTEASDQSAAKPIEYRAIAKDGREVWLEAHPKAQRDPKSGKVIRFQDVARDITYRKALETELERKCAEAEDASVAKTEFLANMSHEIRTPLTGVVGFSDLLNEIEGLPETAQRYAQRISTAGKTLLAVVNDILDFSKLEAGQLELDPHKFDPLDFIRETVDLVATQARNKGLELNIKCTGPIAPLVLADSSRLRQVLLNLLTNAIKFTAKGRVDVKVSYQDDGGGMLRVAVSDTGKGIAEALQERLFQRFSQVDGSISRHHGGTGLGLAICKSLVGLMGGDIGVMGGDLGVDVREGEGSVFWFTIAAPPAVPDEVVVDDDRPEQAFRAAHILIVDDVAVNRELVRTMLEPMGHSFEEADNGAGAVQAAMQEPFDLILMDMQMPGMDGMAATRAIRASSDHNRRTPILALTANVLATQVAACHAAGMDGHIAKPISPRDLLEKVTLWCDRNAADMDENAVMAASDILWLRRDRHIRRP
jgi:PAS domain S-box-containing protein